MKIVIADERRRVTLRCCKPGQAFSVHPHPNGSVTLLPVVKVGKINLQRRCELRLNIREFLKP